MTRQQRGYLSISLACIACLTITIEDLFGLTIRLLTLGILGWALFKFAATDH